MDIPAELKYITPFIQRGQELTNRDPIVSYYAQYYAAKLAIARGPRTKETNEYLSHLLDSLETQKKAIGDNEAITDDIVGYAHVENFALKIFVNADNEDRAGKASKKTAKTFLAASIFLELLKTFGEIDSEVESKIKYAKWKATDIMKALREGRTPTPGPAGTEEEPEVEINASEAPSNELPPSISEFPSPPSNFTAPLPSSSPKQQKPEVSIPPPQQQQPTNIPPPTISTQQPPVHQQPVVAPQAATNTYNEINPQNIANAQKNCKWAISALDYDDIKTARTQLLSALNELGFNQENNFGF